MSDIETLEKQAAQELGIENKSPEASDVVKQMTDFKQTNERYKLPDVYEILTDSPLKHLNSSRAVAFEINDKKQKDSNLYALILPNNLPIRFSHLQNMREIFHSNLSNIVDAGFTEAGGGKHGNFAVVCEKPVGSLLTEYMQNLERPEKEDGTKDYLLDEEFIAKNIVEPINDILKTISENGLSHGNLNHTNIYIDESEGLAKLKLLESVSEPCGVSQLHQYETISRAQASPLGKGESRIESDYFALGVLIFYCMYGDLPQDGGDLPAFLEKRLTYGSYATYLGNTDVSTRMVDALRGLLNDNVEERWGYQQVSDWVRGKRSNLIRPSFRKESVRSYQYDQKKHFTRRALAHDYFTSWPKAAQDLRGKKILKWLELSVGQKDQSEEISSLISATGGEKSRSRKDDDELAAKTLVILDPAGPIRLRNISTHIDGIGVVLADAWSKRNQVELQEMKEIFSLNLPDFKVVKDLYTDRSSERWLLQRLNTFINIDAYGFGIERCLYDLNTGLPCQSQLLGSQFIIDLSHMIRHLDENASKLSELEPVDRHLAAFIAGRLELSKPISPSIPGLALSKNLREKLVKITLLYHVQKRTNVSRLTGLTEWVVNSIKGDFMEVINGKTLQEEFSKDMNKAAKSGSISSILETLTKGGYFSKNKTGLQEAKREYSHLSNSVRLYSRSLENAKKYKTFYLTGLYLAKVISILVFVLVISIVAL